METNQKLKLLTWAVILLVVVNISALVLVWINSPKPKDFMQREGPPFGREKGFDKGLDKGVPRKDRFLEELKSDLGWTDAQLQKVKELKAQKFKNIEGLRDSIPAVKKELLEEIYKAPVDTNRINSLTKRLGDLQYKIEYNFFMHFTDVAGVSNTEQKEKMKDVFDKAILNANAHTGNHEDGPKRPPPMRR